MKLKVKKVKGPKIEVISIKDEYIKLDSLLKFSMAAETVIGLNVEPGSKA